MSKTGKTIDPGQNDKLRRVRRGLPLLLVLVLFGSCVVTLITTMASSDIRPAKPHTIPPVPGPTASDPASKGAAPGPTATPEGAPVSNIPPQTPAARVTVILGEKKELQIVTGVDSVVMVSDEIASAETTNRFTIKISALKLGETILIVNSGPRRNTYIVAVIAKPLSAERANLASQLPARKTPASTGAFTTTYSAGAGGTSALRQNFYYSHKLSDERTLRVAGDMFKLLGDGNPDLAFARVENFGLNRLSAGIDTKSRSIDVLDSELNVSPLSLNSYTMRGFHLASRPSAATVDNLPERGLEVFAGLARPSVSFYDNANGKIAGAMIPVFSSVSFKARAGVIQISPEGNNRTAPGGTVFQMDAAWAPTSHLLAEAEALYSKGNASWRGKLDLKYAKFGGTAEVFHLARSSPFNSIGAQPGGRDSRSFSFYWRPTTRFASSAGYNHTKVLRVANSVLADFDRSLFFAGASYNLGRGSRINIRYTDQSIETAVPRSLSKFRIETRTLLAGYNARFGKNWSNTVEGRLNFSRESDAGAELENGFSVNEQLRYNWHGGSVAGFVNYTHKSPSLTSLIVRNPQLLPSALQAAFALDPAEFIRLNRDRIATLLNGVELPLTRSLDMGVRAQKSVSRFTVQAEARYNAGEVLAVNQKNLYLSTSVGVKIDNANSLQLSAWKSIGGRGDGGLTVSYTHQLGTSGGDGFQFSRLFNFERGKIRGRVFYDLNGNGRPDPGEHGAAGMKVQIDGKRSVVTDKDGQYELSADEGRHKVIMTSGELGVSLLANTPTENILDVDAGQKLVLNFGVRDFGSVSGKIFNDALQGRNAPGLGGVKVILRSVNVGNGGFVLQAMTNGNGAYEFANLRPGAYTIEIDTSTLPADFCIPAVIVSPVNVGALKSTYFDMPVSAQRAVTGIVFIDKNGDRKFTSGIDVPVEGAYVTFGEDAVISDANGAYLFRNLKAGKGEIVGRSPQGVLGVPVVVELDTDPVTRRAVDIPIER
jgi:hypothetical protein